MTDHPDYLRTPNNMFNPDPRSEAFSILREQGLRAKALQDQYGTVAKLVLHDGVPREVIVKFETAKNLNLFSWFVYRFHSAARSHAYECLELALRKRFGAEVLALEQKRRREKYEQQLRSNPNAKPPQPIDEAKFRPGMSRLLEHAIDSGTLRNENFIAWQSKTMVRAQTRNDLETIKKMIELGLSQLEVDKSDVQITDEDCEHDYLAGLLRSIPWLRNHYAHGTTALDNHSLSALRVVSEIINQIFPTPEVTPANSTALK